MAVGAFGLFDRQRTMWQDRAMGRNEFIQQILELAPALKAEGATHLYIYGSRVQGTERPDNDLDVFIEYNPESRFALLELAGIQMLLDEEVK